MDILGGFLFGIGFFASLLVYVGVAALILFATLFSRYLREKREKERERKKMLGDDLKDRMWDGR